MMLNYLGYEQESVDIYDAIVRALADKKATKDVGGSLSGAEAAQNIVTQLTIL